MENASKALIMAGSILMALMVIAVVIFMYNQLAGIEQTKESANVTDKLAEYVKKFEQYNKTIYGSELMSLANLQDDYNKIQADMKGYETVTDDYNKIQADMKGYETVTIEVKIHTTIEENGTTYFQAKNEYIEISKISESVASLKEAIEYYEKKTYEVGKTKKTTKTIKEYSQMSRREIATLNGDDISSSTHDYDINIPERLKDLIDEYKNLKTCYTQFKQTKFKCNGVEYDDVGRIKKMQFEEIKR